MQAIVTGGQTRLMTRGGNDWTRRFPETAVALGRLPNTVLDGELVATGEDGMPDFAALQSAVLGRATAGLLFYAFDLIAQGGEDLRARPLLERKAALKKLLRNAPERVIYVEPFDSPGAAVLNSACAMGLEGIVSKLAGSPYRPGARSGEWVKLKCRKREEFVVGGYSAGAKRHMSLVLGAWRDGRLIHLGSVGSGISEAVERDLMDRLAPLHRDSSPFAGAAAASERRAVVWVEPRLVAAVDYAGWTADGRLRQPSFKGIREVEMPRPPSRASKRR